MGEMNSEDNELPTEPPDAAPDDTSRDLVALSPSSALELSIPEAYLRHQQSSLPEDPTRIMPTRSSSTVVSETAIPFEPTAMLCIGSLSTAVLNS